MYPASREAHKWPRTKAWSMSTVSRLVESVLEMPVRFADIAAHDPLSAVLLVIGALLVGVSSAVFGFLVVGAGVDLVTPDSGGRTYPPDR